MSLLHPATATYIENIAPAERWDLEFGSNTTENIFKHHGNFFQTPGKKLKTHKAGSKKST